MRAAPTIIAILLLPPVLAAGLPCQAAEHGGVPPPAAAIVGEGDDADQHGDEGAGVGLALHAGAVALGAALGAAGGFSVGASLAGVAYPLVRREPPIGEGLTVAVGTPTVLAVAGAGLGALLAPVVLGEPLSVAGGVGASGGAAVAGVAAAVPGAYLTWEATKSLGAAFDEPSPEGCLLSMVGLSASLSVMFGGLCVGATCGGAAGGAGGALLDAPAEPPPPPVVPVAPEVAPTPPVAVAF